MTFDNRRPMIPEDTLPTVEEVTETLHRRHYIASGLFAKKSALGERDRQFAEDLLVTYIDEHTLSPKQWEHLERLLNTVTASEPLYGDFKPIWVMMQIAGQHLQRPKIRFITAENEYFELWFDRDRRPVEIPIMRDGWQGHGRRWFAGRITPDSIVPRSESSLPTSIRILIQEFCLDPLQVARAMALRLTACMYCGQRLSDEESKNRGYGPVCAQHFHQPWGTRTESKIKADTELLNLLAED